MRFVHGHGKSKPRPEITQPENQKIRYVPLTKGRIATVDAEDYEYLMQWRWRAKGKEGYFYAERGASRSEKAEGKKVIRMQNLLCDLQEGEIADHANGDSLNYCRWNLRPATQEKNSWNQKMRKNNTTGFTGVCREGKGFRADIGVGGRKTYLGHFDRAEEAGVVYEAASRAKRGDFVRSNVTNT